MKITKSYLQKVIKEELNKELEEGVSAGAIAGTVLAVLMGVAGLEAYEATQRFQEIMTKVKSDGRGYDELKQFFKQETGEDPKNMSQEDLKIFAAGKEIEK